MCGEREFGPISVRLVGGSSPRVRGTPQAGLRQLLQPAFTAREIFHMATDEASPVIRELGVANLATALVALLSIVASGFVLPVAIALVTVWSAIAISYVSNWPIGFFVGGLGALSFGIGRSWAAFRRTRTARIGPAGAPVLQRI